MFPAVAHPYCVENNIPTEIFFPDADYKYGIAIAKSICAKCSSRDECGEIAIENWVEDGIWGGLDEHDRKIIWRQRALRRHSSPNNKPHVQEHPMRAYSFCPERTSFPSNHTQQVSDLRVARELASKVGPILLSQLQSPEKFPLGPSQKLLLSHFLAGLRNSQSQLDHKYGKNPEWQVTSDPLSSQMTGLITLDLGLQKRAPSLL